MIVGKKYSVTLNFSWFAIRYIFMYYPECHMNYKGLYYEIFTIFSESPSRVEDSLTASSWYGMHVFHLSLDLIIVSLSRMYDDDGDL